MGRSIRRAVSGIGRSVESIVRGTTDVAGGIVDSVLGTNITGNNVMPQLNLETPTTTTEVNQAITPEGSVTGKGQADLSDTGLGDVVSVFDMFSDQEDEMDILLGRKYNK